MENNQEIHQSLNFTASEMKIIMDLWRKPEYSILRSQKKDQRTAIMQRDARKDIHQNFIKMRLMQCEYDARQNNIDVEDFEVLFKSIENSDKTQMSLTAGELKKTQDKDIQNKDYQQPISTQNSPLMNFKSNSALTVIAEELPTTSKQGQKIQNPAAMKVNNQSKGKGNIIETIVSQIYSKQSSASGWKDSMFTYPMLRIKEENFDNYGPGSETVIIDLTSDSEGDDSSEKSVNIKPQKNVESNTLEKEVEKQHNNSILNINGENQSFVTPTYERLRLRKTQPGKLIKPRQNLAVNEQPNELPRQVQDTQKEITTNKTVEDQLEAMFGPDSEDQAKENPRQDSAKIVTRRNTVLSTGRDSSFNRVEDQQNPRQDVAAKIVKRRNTVLSTGRDSSFNRVGEKQNRRQDLPAKRVTRQNSVLPTGRDSSSIKLYIKQNEISKQYSGSNTVEDHPTELTRSNSTSESDDEPPNKMAKGVPFLPTCSNRCVSISNKVEEQPKKITGNISVAKEIKTRPKSVLKRTKQNKRPETVTSSPIITLQNSNVLESSISLPGLSIDELRMTKCDNCIKKSDEMGTSDGTTPDFFAKYPDVKKIKVFILKVQSPIKRMTFMGGLNENLFYNIFEKMNNNTLFKNKCRQRLHVYDTTKFQDEKPFFALYSQSCKPHFCEASDDKFSIIRESELHSKRFNKIKQHPDRIRSNSIYVILYSFDEDLYLDLPQNNFWTKPNTTLRLKKSIDNKFNFIFASKIALADVNIYGSYYAEFVYLGRSLDDEMEKNYDSKPLALDCGLLHYCKSYSKNESRDEMEYACDIVDKFYLDKMPKNKYD